jgi:hypothetical protein
VDGAEAGLGKELIVADDGSAEKLSWQDGASALWTLVKHWVMS